MGGRRKKNKKGPETTVITIKKTISGFLGITKRLKQKLRKKRYNVSNQLKITK